MKYKVVSGFFNGPFEALFLAIPFYFLWNFLQPIYWPQVPAPYAQLPFWHCVALFLLVWVVRSMIFPFRRSEKIVGFGKKWE